MQSEKPEKAKTRIRETKAFLHTKLFLKRIVGREIWLSADTKLNTARFGDWTACPDFLTADSIVYSLGIGEDAAFDFELVREKNLEVHGFDPTPNSAAWLSGQAIPGGFHFHPWAVTARDGTIAMAPRVKSNGRRSRDMYTVIDKAGASDHAIEVQTFSLQSIMTKLGHRSIDILKMDIEGAEYDVLSSLLATSIRPVQLLVEFHHRFPGISKASTIDAIRDLRNAGYQIFHIADTGREMSFIKLPERGIGPQGDVSKSGL